MINKDKTLDIMLAEGNHCFDEICVELEITPNELDMKIKARSDIITYYK